MANVQNHGLGANTIPSSAPGSPAATKAALHESDFLLPPVISGAVATELLIMLSESKIEKSARDARRNESKLMYATAHKAADAQLAAAEMTRNGAYFNAGAAAAGGVMGMAAGGMGMKSAYVLGYKHGGNKGAGSTTKDGDSSTAAASTATGASAQSKATSGPGTGVSAGSQPNAKTAPGDKEVETLEGGLAMSRTNKRDEAEGNGEGDTSRDRDNDKKETTKALQKEEDAETQGLQQHIDAGDGTGRITSAKHEYFAGWKIGLDAAGRTLAAVGMFGKGAFDFEAELHINKKLRLEAEQILLSNNWKEWDDWKARSKDHIDRARQAALDVQSSNHQTALGIIQA